ncbi:SDR family oxidoreductase [Oculatella sp. FACHB-28]|uniref:SDR family oxidoreductase n=1 Tax=Cyanophyceae TaxID=3028117 RepID=UPI001681EBBC|nr:MULTISPECIES: SDR family oxidoreductase [Cyanophyceae]MBD1871790.1 SDR family oxidoreductase [Cyanobacteria bacterium FACHB-471]MBD1999736.1 SDR family oxidoreductase [Leptolyngbya sp. FACHB-541]MBD2057845.1 SDR family oxidoreductase [Oculatella sp. FACHB-28]
MFLVTGATGDLGTRVVKRLREEEKPVRAFARLTSRYAELESRGAEIFVGDLLKERDIQKACQGIRYVISTHGASEAGGGTAETLDYRANIDLIDAAKAAGVEHFVFISVLGADRGYEDAPTFKAKRAVENYLQASGLNYTILRPSGFASNIVPLAERFKQSGIYFTIGDLRIRSSIVSTDDLARIAVDSVAIDAARNQIFAVGGPEIIERGNIPKIFEQIFNQEPVVINPPIGAVDGIRTVVGFFNPEAKQALGTFRTLLSNEFYCTATEIERLESVFNMRMETLDSYIRRYVPAQA